MRPVVDQEGFDQIQCSQCGECCESFVLSGDEELKDFPPGPIGWLQWYHSSPTSGQRSPALRDEDSMLFFGQLTPHQDEDGAWSYACGYFARDDDGLGICTVYDRRPEMCSDFPYGKPVKGDTYGSCTWNVELVDFEPVTGEVPCLT